MRRLIACATALLALTLTASACSGGGATSQADLDTATKEILTSSGATGVGSVQSGPEGVVRATVRTDGGWQNWEYRDGKAARGADSIEADSSDYLEPTPVASFPMAEFISRAAEQAKSCSDAFVQVFTPAGSGHWFGSAACGKDKETWLRDGKEIDTSMDTGTPEGLASAIDLLYSLMPQGNVAAFFVQDGQWIISAAQPVGPAGTCLPSNGFVAGQGLSVASCTGSPGFAGLDTAVFTPQRIAQDAQAVVAEAGVEFSQVQWSVTGTAQGIQFQIGSKSYPVVK